MWQRRSSLINIVFLKLYPGSTQTIFTEENREEKLPLTYKCYGFGGTGMKMEIGRYTGDSRHYKSRSEMQSCKNPGHTKLPRCPCCSLCVVSDKRHYSISFYIKFPPEMQNPLYHSCCEKHYNSFCNKREDGLAGCQDPEAQVTRTDLPNSSN